jgi:formate dehydrogenase subunit gamma
MKPAGSVLPRPPVDREPPVHEEWVLRFTRTERFLHWWTVAMAAAALLTGLGVGDDGSGPMLVAHVAAVVLVGVGIITALVIGDRRALLRAARELFGFDRRDAAWLRELRRRPLHYPSGTDCGMFNPGQKLLAWALPFVAAALIVTGIASAVGGGVLGGLHDATVVFALVLLGAHVFMAVVNPTPRHALNGMVFGRVRRSWAAHHHGAWLDELDQRR